MGRRKDYPFSRRAHKQGLGFLSKSIIGMLGAGAYAADGIKKAVEDGNMPPNIEYADKYSHIFMIVFYILLAILAVLMLVLVYPLVSDIFDILF